MLLQFIEVTRIQISTNQKIQRYIQARVTCNYIQGLKYIFLDIEILQNTRLSKGMCAGVHIETNTINNNKRIKSMFLILTHCTSTFAPSCIALLSYYPNCLMFLNSNDINLTNDPLNGYVKYNLSYLQQAKGRHHLLLSKITGMWKSENHQPWQEQLNTTGKRTHYLEQLNDN